MALGRSFPTQHPSGTPITDVRRELAGLVARNADGTPRPGVFPAHANSLVTGRASMSYDIAPFIAALSRVNTGVELAANDAVTIFTPAGYAAPASNSRIDTIWVRAQFGSPVAADANNDVVFGITLGTPAPIPQRPTNLPPGVLELADAEIPSTATTTSSSGVVITPRHPFTAAANAPVWLRNAAEQAAWNAPENAEAWRLDLKQRLIYMPGATTPGWFLVGGKPTTSAPTFAGIYSAGTPAPRVVEQAGRVSLEGTVTSSSANFVAGTTYTLGSIPASKAPVAARKFACMSNGTAVALVTVDTNGALTMVLNTSFTGALSLSLDGCSWPDKNL